MKKIKNKYFNGLVHTADYDLPNDDRETILTWIFQTNLVQWYATYLLQKPYEDDEVQDLIGELFLIICEIDEAKWKELFQQGKFAISGYVTGIIRQQLYSDSSRIYHHFIKRKKREITMSEEFWEQYADEH